MSTLEKIKIEDNSTNKESDPNYSYINSRDISLSSYQVTLGNFIFYINFSALMCLLLGSNLAKTIPPKQKKKTN